MQISLSVFALFALCTSAFVHPRIGSLSARSIGRCGVCVSMSDEGMSGQAGDFLERPPRSKIPQRRDTCRILLSGVIGTDPRESYLSNGHYVMNFALAVQGHFLPQHSWEEFKPTETMWVNTEVWDDQAKKNAESFSKGSPLNAVGILIFNKWTDKTTGEDRKQFKVRITNVISPDDMGDMLGSSGVLDLEGNGEINPEQDPSVQSSDSGFQDYAPKDDDQSIGPPITSPMTGDDRDERIPF